MSPGKHLRVEAIHGDFFDSITSIPEESVQLIFSDPPYFLSSGGMSVQSGRQASVNKGKWDVIPAGLTSLEFHRNWIREVRRVLHPDGAIVVSGTYHSIYETGVALSEAGFRILNEIVWFKPNGAPNLSGRRLAASHETLIWASKSPKSRFTFNYQELRGGDFPGDKLKNPNKQMRSVWSIPTTPRSEKQFGHHPTQKPLALLDRVVMAFSREGDLVLDPFMGSGTTGVSCQTNGRNFIGIERDEAYFKLANLRLGKSVD